MGTNKITYLDRVFEAHDVIKGNAYYVRSLISSGLEIDTFSFDVQSNDTGLTEFIRNTPLTFYHDGNQMGIFYVQTISRTSINTYHFTCTSTVGLLDETYHDGGVYTGETVREVCADICSPLTCYVKSNIANIKLYGWLPIATRRENLTQVLFAIGATLKVDYNGAIRIEGLWDGQSSEITASEMYAGGSVEYATPVTEVIVTEHAYSQSTTEVAELFNGTTAAGDKITFDEPCYDLEATGFEITESGANYAIVTAGSGVLNGKKYTHVTRQIIIPTSINIRSLAEQSNNTVKVEKATLVSLVNANALAERLAEYYSHNERINNKVAIKREYPGDVVKIAHPYGGTANGCIESVDITVSGRLAAQESVLVGYQPKSIVEQEYYDTVRVITQNGSWSVPDTVTSIRVILIGGGRGGSSGSKGQDGDENGTGGAGGDGGNGGDGGKIFSTSLTVTPGQAFSVVIGNGGAGGAFSSEATSTTGALGTQTTFGTLTSESGTASPTGFTDPVNGQTYATSGQKGTAGGKGGDGGAESESEITTETLRGQDGQSVGSNSGGQGAAGASNSVSGESAYNGGGGGGGAARGGNGSDGTAGKLRRVNFDTPSLSGYHFQGYGGDGGAGGTATVIPDVPTAFGTGGTGGNGGGGGGAPGVCSAVGGTRGNTPGTGGNGSDGGTGAPGCVLVYYRLPKPAAVSGAVQDKTGASIFDRYGRRLIV